MKRNTTMTQQQQAIAAALQAALDTLSAEWPESEKTHHFAVTIHNQDQTLFVDGGITLHGNDD